MTRSDVNPFQSPEQQLESLLSRGLLVTDMENAIKWLRRIGYFRLTAYLYPFRDVNGVFQEGTSIEHALRLYVFDKKLRLLVLDATERIEVAVRVEIALLLGAKDPIAHLNPAYLHEDFTNKILPNYKKTNHQIWLEKLERSLLASNEDFVPHFLEQHKTSIPIWVAIELWDFGMLSRFYRGMKKADQRQVANLFDITNGQTLANWLLHMNLLRNIAAHHGRLWNRKLVIAPSLKGTQNLIRVHRWINNDESRILVAGSIGILDHLVSVIQPDSKWSIRVINLLKDFPDVPNISVAHMGLNPSLKTIATLIDVEPAKDSPKN